MLSKNEIALLREWAKPYIPDILAFTECESVYDLESNAVIDSKCRMLYESAVEAMRLWVKVVLGIELMGHAAKYHVSCRLILPNKNILLASAEYKDEVVGVRGTPFALCDDMIQTPVGEMSHFMYEVITQIPDNPVSLFYSYLAKCIEKLHGYMSMYAKEDVVVLSRADLQANNIQDVLGIYKLDSMLKNIGEFL